MNLQFIGWVPLCVYVRLCIGSQSQDDVQTATAKAASTCLVQARKQSVAGNAVTTEPAESLFIDPCSVTSWTASTVLQQSWPLNSTSDDFPGLFVHPPSNFAFCLIPKNGCTSWGAIMHKIFYNQLHWIDSDYEVPELSTAFYGMKAVEHVFNDPKAVRAVMIREPLARFASAFLDKCLRENCTSDICIWRTTNVAISFKMAVEGMLAADPRNINAHWALQSQRCGLDKNLHAYNMVVLETKDTMSRDATCMLDHSGLSRWNYWNETLKLFDPDVPMIEHADTSAGEEELLKRLFTVEAARKLMAHLEPDYQTFSLPEPAWVAEATGELYDTYDTGCGGEAYGLDDEARNKDRNKFKENSL